MRCMARSCCSSKSRTARPSGPTIRNSSVPDLSSPSSDGNQAVSSVRPPTELESPEGSPWASWWPLPCVSVIIHSSSLDPQEPFDCGGEFPDLLVHLLRVLDGRPDAVLDVVLE